MFDVIVVRFVYVFYGILLLLVQLWIFLGVCTLFSSDLFALSIGVWANFF